jgi:hypothetical protein
VLGLWHRKAGGPAADGKSKAVDGKAAPAKPAAKPAGKPAAKPKKKK